MSNEYRNSIIFEIAGQPGVDAVKASIAALDQQMANLGTRYASMPADQFVSQVQMLNREIDRHRSVLEDATRSKRNLGRATLEVGRGVQDFAAAGLYGVTNQIEGLSRAVGMGAGAAGALTVLGVAVQVYGPRVLKYFQEMFSTEAPRQLAESIEGLEKQIEELTQKEGKIWIDVVMLDQAKEKLAELTKLQDFYNKMREPKTDKSTRKAEAIEAAITEAGGMDTLAAAARKSVMESVQKGRDVLGLKRRGLETPEEKRLREVTAELAQLYVERDRLRQIRTATDREGTGTEQWNTAIKRWWNERGIGNAMAEKTELMAQINRRDFGYMDGGKRVLGRYDQAITEALTGKDDKKLSELISLLRARRDVPATVVEKLERALTKNVESALAREAEKKESERIETVKRRGVTEVNKLLDIYVTRPARRFGDELKRRYAAEEKERREREQIVGANDRARDEAAEAIAKERERAIESARAKNADFGELAQASILNAGVQARNRLRDPVRARNQVSDNLTGNIADRIAGTGVNPDIAREAAERIVMDAYREIEEREMAARRNQNQMAEKMRELIRDVFSRINEDEQMTIRELERVRAQIPRSRLRVQG